MPRVKFWLYSSNARKGNRPHPLTLDRRNQVLDLWAAGNTADNIAYILTLHRDTVYKHLTAGRRAKDARAVSHRGVGATL